MSLTSYEQFFNEDNETIKAEHLRNHLRSIYNHISSLGNKNYQQLYEINTLDYVILYIPIEPALIVAMKEDMELLEKAINKNIVIVSTSTLIATLKVISYLWKQENQKRNVDEIARESGALYDKFVGFIEDLRDVGNRIDSAKSHYVDAMNKLVDSKQVGGTLIGRIERIRKLGANATKTLPQDIIEQINNE